MHSKIAYNLDEVDDHVSLKKLQALDSVISREIDELTKKQEDAGLIGVTDLLSVEETLLSAEMNLATARNNELDAVVDLAKALGGGWTRQDMKDTAKK